MKKTRNAKGITLIALIITIIVLLILAGITLSTLAGRRGIINQAQNAEKEHTKASALEDITMVTYQSLDNKGNMDTTKLEQGLNEIGATIKSKTENKWTVEQNGYEFEIDIETGDVIAKGTTGETVSEPTDIYVFLYTDGTLSFSNNNQPIEEKTVEAPYGNIKDEVFEINETNGMPNIPWLQVDSTDPEEAQNQLMEKCAKIKEVTINNKIAPKNTSWWFAGLMNVQEINGIENIVTSNVIDMTGMFFGCESLTNLNLSNFDTSSVTNMTGMFSSCRSLTNLNISNFDTSNVTNMAEMFSSCESLTSLNISNFDTSSVTNMTGIFNNCYNLTSLNLNNFNTSNVTNMAEMFRGCNNLTSLNLSNFDTSNVTDMESMFSYCNNLTSLNLNNFNTNNVTNMAWMFGNCDNLTSLNLSNFDTSNVTDMAYMFYYCNNLTSLNLSNFDTSNVTDTEGMFAYCQSLDISNNLGITNWNTDSIMNFEHMFYNLKATGSTIDISKWNISQDASIDSMFAGNNITVYVKDNEIKTRFENDTTQNTGNNYIVK